MRVLIKETPNKVGETVELMGWVSSRRDHGKLIFLDLRDRSGVVQAVVTPKSEAYEQAQKLRDEWVLRVKVQVKERPENMINEDIETGKIEVSVEELEILSESETPPLPISGDGLDIDEEVRLKYRYLDLRRDRLQKNLRTRSKFVSELRKSLFEQDFIEVETPLLTKTTPEGARDFVVPSRHQLGKFFALPQSPQQYKQLLMVAGVEKYFQIARALRDEDLRADRAFEHSQLDLEMSFVDQGQVMATVEKMMIQACEAMGKKLKDDAFPKFEYKEAVEKFGEDRFDLRDEKEKEAGVLAFAWVHNFPAFEEKEDGSWTFMHNPFTMPKEENAGDLEAGKDIEGMGSWQYDLVCNGYEVGSGSIRIHNPEVLKSALKIMGYSDERMETEFGHMIEAFKYGAPPHGGIALGIERLIMILTGEEFLREVQAFPQTSSGRTSVMDAPSELSSDQLNELGLEIKKEDK